MRYKSISDFLIRFVTTLAALAVAFLIFESVLLAQDTPTLTPNAGFQVRTVSAYVGYYSSGLANTGSLQSGAANLQFDVGGGASATFEYTKLGERSSFSVNYTPSYMGQVRYSSLNALNHAFSLNASRKLAPRWNFTFSAAGDLSSLQQSLFSPTRLSNVAAVPSTFDDLAAGVLSAQFANNPQLANVLTSAQLAQSPLLTLLYGQRIFTSTVRTSVSYSYSPRLSVTFSGGASRTQQVSDGQSGTSNKLLANTTSADADVAISYSLSPLTHIGGNVTTTRVSSTIQDSYITTSVASLGRTVGRRWIVQVHGGAGITNPVGKTSFAASQRPHPAIGGSLGFKTMSNTFLGAYDRTVSDPYGAGASTSSVVSATWHWRQPGRTWFLESSMSWQQLGGGSTLNGTAAENPALINTSGWNASAGLGRAVGTNLVLHSEYAYLYFSRKPVNSLSQSAVRVSLVWSRNSTWQQ